MRNIKKISLLGAIGGSALLLNAALDTDQQAIALTKDTDGIDQLDAGKRAAKLIGVLTLLFDEEPVMDDFYRTEQDTLLNVLADDGVLANDAVGSGHMLVVVDDVDNGILNLANDGSFDYLPNTNFTGLDSFRYAVTLGNGQSFEADVTIKVNGMPEAFDDNFNFDGSSPFLGNVISNSIGGSDTIVDDATVVSVDNVSTTLGGTVTIQTDGSFEYSPPINLGIQVDSYVYTLEDSDGESDTATITWQILPSIVGIDSAVSVFENQLLATQITLSTPGSLEYLGLNSSQYTLSQLNSASSLNPLQVDAETLGSLTIIGYNETTGVVDLAYDPTGTTQDHSGASNDVLLESIDVKLKDTSRIDVISGTLTIEIVDTNPVANNDARSITEGTSTISGNAVGNGLTGDVQDIIIDPATVTDLDFGATDGTVGSPLDGDYGNLVIASNGVYTYTLDNTDSAVQGLKNGESLVEVFTYTLTDNEAPNADSDSATIMMTLNGVDDALPTVVVSDDNGAETGQNTVLEASAATVTGQISVTATAGIQTLTVAGQDVTNATAVPVIIAGSEGTLSVTDFDVSEGEITYSYLEDGNSEDHSAGEIQDSFAIVLTDNEGDTAAVNSLDVLIADTAPTAIADTRSVTEDETGIAGNLVTGTNANADTLGADTPTNYVTGAAVGDAGAVELTVDLNTDLVGTYGTLTIQADGEYAYVTNAAAQALVASSSVTDTFSYTIKDSDGDFSTTTVTMTVTGINDAPFVTVVDDNGIGLVGDYSVAENLSMTGAFIVTAEAGLNASSSALSITVDGATTNISLAQLNGLSGANIPINSGNNGNLSLTNYDAGTGVVSLSFDPTGSNRNHAGGDTSVLENYVIVVNDADDTSSPAETLDILITDTSPIANNDARSITEGTSTIAGNAVGNGSTGDVQDIVIDPATVTDLDFGATDGTVGSNLDGDYGKLIISSTGVYTYTLDNNNSDVQGLKSGDILVEEFVYTLTDNETPNADSDTASIMMTLNGVDDALPTVVVRDDNGGIAGENSVADATAETVLGLITVTATAGVQTLTIAGQDVSNATAVPVVISTSEGTLTVNGFNASTGEITYFYTENGAFGGEVLDSFAIVLTDNEGDTAAADSLDILITQIPPVGGIGAATGTQDDTGLVNNLATGTSKRYFSLSNGDMIIKAYDSSSGDVSYDYKPKGTFADYSAGTNRVIGQVTISVENLEGDSAINSLQILMTDTQRITAQDAVISIAENTHNTIDGNALNHDTQSMGAGSAVYWVSVNGGSATPRNPFTSQDADVNSDGSFSFLLNNADAANKSLYKSHFLSWVVNGTMVDADGHQSTDTIKSALGLRC